MRGYLKEMADDHVKDAGEFKAGMNRFSQEVTEFIKDEKYDNEEFSIRELFDAAVVGDPDNIHIDFAEGTDLVSIQEATARSVFPKITSSLIYKELIPAYESSLGDALQLCTVGSTTQAEYEYIAGTTAMPTLQAVEAGQNYPEATFAEKNVRIQMKKFGHIVSLEMETIMSDQTGKLLERARESGDIIGDHQHRFIIETIADIARNALGESSSTALYWGGSARTVYANDHSSWDEYTNDNLAATTSGDSTSEWGTMWSLLANMRNRQGGYIKAIPKWVICHPNLYPQTRKFLVSIGEPDTGNNANNFYSTLGIRPFITQYLTANTDWLMGDPKKQTQWLWYKKPNVQVQGASSDAAFERDIIARFKPNYYGGCGLKDYRFVVEGNV